jgi:hypothetical protein
LKKQLFPLFLIAFLAMTTIVPAVFAPGALDLALPETINVRFTDFGNTESTTFP